MVISPTLTHPFLCKHTHNVFSELRVPFACARDAEVAYNTLRVDPEPPRSGVIKSLQYDRTSLIVLATSWLYNFIIL